MCLTRPYKLNPAQVRTLIAYKAFWEKDGELYPVVHLEKREDGRYVAAGYDYRITVKPMKADALYQGRDFGPEDNLFHACQIPDVGQVTTTLAVEVLTAYMKELVWWKKGELSTCGARLAEGFKPVVADVELRGNLTIDLDTSQVAGSEMMILDYYKVEL